MELERPASPKARREAEWALAVALLALGAPSPVRAQGVVVDQGTFAVSVNGQRAGTEEFTIRRAGLNREDALFATATTSLTRDGATQRIRLLLRADPLEGTPKCEGAEPCYQVDVEGAAALSLRLALAGRRYVARVVDSEGEEIREFPAAAMTRILEADVAHLHYFLKDLQEGAVSPVLVPRERTTSSLTAGPWTEEEIQLGSRVVRSRRVTFTGPGGSHTVWFDLLGRVLRVSIPERGYLAERTDLVG